VTLLACPFFVAVAMVHEDFYNSLTPPNKGKSLTGGTHIVRKSSNGKKRIKKKNDEWKIIVSLRSGSRQSSIRVASPCWSPRDRSRAKISNLSTPRRRVSVSLIRRQLSRISERHSIIPKHIDDFRFLYTTKFPERSSLRYLMLSRLHWTTSSPSAHVKSR